MPKVVGKVVQLKLALVQPNPWNPNRFTPQLYASLKHGLSHDGWLAAQAMLVWGKDAKGVTRNLIIDGEHRWRAATELGMVSGPAVVLDGLTELQAKQFTIKLDAKRGAFEREPLSAVLRQIQFDLGVADLGLELGFSNEDLMRYLASPSIDTVTDESDGGGAPPPAPPLQSQNAHTTMVPLFFDEATHGEFTAALPKFEQRFKTTVVTETVLAVLREAAKAKPAKRR